MPARRAPEASPSPARAGLSPDSEPFSSPPLSLPRPLSPLVPGSRGAAPLGSGPRALADSDADGGRRTAPGGDAGSNRERALPVFSPEDVPSEDASLELSRDAGCWEPFSAGVSAGRCGTGVPSAVTRGCGRVSEPSSSRSSAGGAYGRLPCSCDDLPDSRGVREEPDPSGERPWGPLPASGDLEDPPRSSWPGSAPGSPAPGPPVPAFAPPAPEGPAFGASAEPVSPPLPASGGLVPGLGPPDPAAPASGRPDPAPSEVLPLLEPLEPAAPVWEPLAREAPGVPALLEPLDPAPGVPALREPSGPAALGLPGSVSPGREAPGSGSGFAPPRPGAVPGPEALAFAASAPEASACAGPRSPSGEPGPG